MWIMQISTSAVETPDICGSNAECADTVGSYTCSCQEGYERSRDSQHCTGKKFQVRCIANKHMNLLAESNAFQPLPYLAVIGVLFCSVELMLM